MKHMLTPNVLDHLPMPLQQVTTAADWVEARLAESGVLQVIERKTGGIIGLILLARSGGDVHLGYLLAESAWGKGYATELVQELLPELQASGAQRVIGGVSEKNFASARVLIKSGFKKGESTDKGTTRYVWNATA